VASGIWQLMAVELLKWPAKMNWPEPKLVSGMTGALIEAPPPYTLNTRWKMRFNYGGVSEHSFLNFNVHFKFETFKMGS